MPLQIFLCLNYWFFSNLCDKYCCLMFSFQQLYFPTICLFWMRVPVPSDVSKRNLPAIEYKREPNVLAVPICLFSSWKPRNDSSDLLSLSPLLISHHAISNDCRVSFKCIEPYSRWRSHSLWIIMHCSWTWKGRRECILGGKCIFLRVFLVLVLDFSTC